MKFGALCCIYEDYEYLDICMRISKYLDEVLFVINKRPWDGLPSDNSSTIERIKKLCRDNPNMTLLQGDWKDEVDQRNAGLSYFFKNKFNISFIIDNDEIYTDVEFNNIKKFILLNPQYDAYHIEWNTYWTKDLYKIDPRESFCPCIAVRPEHFLFTYVRQGITSVIRTGTTTIKTSGVYKGIKIPPEIAICHHLSYARTNEFIKRKIEISSHSSEMQKDWYDKVWLAWKPGHKNLHPVTPSQYEKAVPVSFRQLPNPLKVIFKKDRISKRPCTICILNWNSKELLKRCLRNIRANTQEIPYNVVIVDNGSSKDDSVRYLKVLERFCPRIKVIYNSKNRGFAPGVNQAMKASPDTDICVLNVDAEPQKDWLKELYKTIIENPGAGIVGPLGNQVASGCQSEGYTDRDAMVTNLHGYCLFILKEVIDSIGYFDEGYPVGNYEDNDYGMRAKLAGYELWISSKSLVIHKAHQVFRLNGLDPYKQEAINREIYVNKFHSILYSVSHYYDLFKDENLAKTLRLKID